MSQPASQSRVVKAACPHDCPDTCAMLVTVENGVATKVRGDPDHPTTQGALCTKVSRYIERTYHPDRILHPMKRVGRKGEGRFARISWDEALDTIAARLSAIAADDPQAILPYAYSGTLGLVQNFGMPRRFFHRLGATQLERTLCASAARTAYQYVVGAQVGTDIVHFAESELIVLWGSNPIASNLHLWTRVVEARRRGARVIVIDPVRTESAEKADWHLAPAPGTDAALALGMMQVLIAEDLLDHDYIASHTLGFDALAARAAEFPPERVARITGLAAADIVALARAYGATRRAAIRLNYGMQRHAGGGNAVRAVASLPALTGAWREPSGGVLLDQIGAHGTDYAALDARHLLPDPSCPPRAINMARLGEVLTELDDPPIRALFVYIANPLAVVPNAGLVRKGLQREDLFTVVHEIFMTDTCDYADIVLPATTQLEQFDVHRGYGTLYSVVNEAAIAPLGEAVSNSELFRRLAARMGFTDPELQASDEEIARQAHAPEAAVNAGLDWSVLRRDGWRRIAVPERFAPFADGRFPTPSGRCEFYSASAAAAGHDPVPAFIPPRESALAAPELARRYPLTVLSPATRRQLNTSFGSIEGLQGEDSRPSLQIHPHDAAARGIAEGDIVRVFNDRGSYRAPARLTDRIRPGVVLSPSVWWRKHAPDGENVNAVTSHGLTDIGGGATYYDTAVEVERAP